MFKPKKKINENAIKKDFFKVIKKESGIDVFLETYIKETKFKIVDKILNIILPENGTILNILTKMMFIEKNNCFSSGNFNPDGKIEQVSFDYNNDIFINFTNWIKLL